MGEISRCTFWEDNSTLMRLVDWVSAPNNILNIQLFMISDTGQL